MGKKKEKEYNDFLPDTRHHNDTEIHNTLQTTSPLTRSLHPDQPPKPQRPTHFLCLPLTHPSLKPALAAFSQHIESHTAIPPAAVRPPGTLHLTLGVLTLDQEQLAAATAHLQTLDLHQILRGITTKTLAASLPDTHALSEGLGALADPEVAVRGAAMDQGDLVISLRGLEAMRDVHRTSCLYAVPVDETGRLAAFAESVRSGFAVDRRQGALKLHATVLNTVYVKGRGKGAMQFNAGEVMDAFREFEWADAVRVDRVRICSMGAVKVRDGRGQVVDEVYEVVAEKEI